MCYIFFLHSYPYVINDSMNVYYIYLSHSASLLQKWAYLKWHLKHHSSIFLPNIHRHFTFLHSICYTIPLKIKQYMLHILIKGISDGVITRSAHYIHVHYAVSQRPPLMCMVTGIHFFCTQYTILCIPRSVKNISPIIIYLLHRHS